MTTNELTAILRNLLDQLDGLSGTETIAVLVDNRGPVAETLDAMYGPGVPLPFDADADLVGMNRDSNSHRVLCAENRDRNPEFMRGKPEPVFVIVPSAWRGRIPTREE